ncbi:MAG: helix-turn-helix transcriptional regulator [Candidatus Bathyarchaeia archaeon]
MWLSSGTVYSLLQALENKQLLCSFEKGKTKYYRITKKGKKCLKLCSTL